MTCHVTGGSEVSFKQPRTLLEQLIANGQYTYAELEEQFARHARACGSGASMSWRHLQRIAAGQIARPHPASARVLQHQFGLPVSELLGPPEQPASTPDRPAHVDPDRLAYVAEHPRKVDDGTVQALARTLGEWRRLDDDLGAATVLPSVTVTLERMEKIVRESRGKIRPAVLDVGAQWLQFGGWLNTTTKRHDRARTLQDRMLEWAVELGSPDLMASALSVKGHHAWTLGDYGPMVGLSKAARRDRHASPAVLASAAQQQARGHALIGEADDAERMLDQADEQAVRAAEQPDRLPPWLYFHSTDLLVLQRGLAYKYLAESGNPSYRQKAIDTLAAGLAGLDESTRASEWISWYVEQLDTVTRTDAK